LSTGGGGGGGSSGFGATALNTSVAIDVTGVPSVTFTYTPVMNTPIVFQLSPPVVGSAGTITTPISAPGVGTLNVIATAEVPARFRRTATRRKGHKLPRKIRYGSATLSVPGPGTFSLKVPPGAAARGLLRKGARLTVSIAVTFTPAIGAAQRELVGVTVKGKKNRGG
jgi:hypothetical protein